MFIMQKAKFKSTVNKQKQTPRSMYPCIFIMKTRIVLSVRQITRILALHVINT
jgi:hypothetical protein